MFQMLAVGDQFGLRVCILQTFIIYTLIVGTLVVVGIIGNILTFVVFWKGNFKSSTSFLFMCLALTDSAVLLTAFVVFSIQPLLIYTGYMKDFEIRYFELLVFPAFAHCCAHTATMWMTLLIAINRYIVVCLPLRASLWCTNSKVKKQMAAVLVSAVLYNIAFFVALIFGFPVIGIIFMSVLHAICVLILPICILTALNIRLTKALNTHRRMQMQNRSIQKDTSTTFVLVIVIIVVIICQLPQISRVWSFGRPFTCSSFQFYLRGISDTLVILNSAVNFIIYILCNRRFRDVLMEKVFKRAAPQQVAVPREMAGVERANGEPVNETRL